MMKAYFSLIIIMASLLMAPCYADKTDVEYADNTDTEQVVDINVDVADAADTEYADEADEEYADEIDEEEPEDDAEEELEGDSEESGLISTSLMVQWFPQAQFAGYYVALENGIYEEYGLDVEIFYATPDEFAVDYLVWEEVDFITAWLPTALKENDNDNNFVNLAQIVQKSSLMFVAKKESGISTLSDFNGKKMSIWSKDYEAPPRIFIAKNGLDVDVIMQGTTVNLFLRDGVDIATATWYNEYDTIINSGYDPEDITTFFFKDYGLDLPEDGIYTRGDLYEEDSDMCDAFVKASLEGWRYAFDNKEEAIDIIMMYMEDEEIPASRVHQEWMLDRMEEIIKGDSNEISGELREEDYRRVVDAMKEEGIITNSMEYKEFFKPMIEAQPSP
ncbi:MAG: ABC transporter substrate-binding protein [Waddliaceae bacterium]|nr:ABC transporter substrate-binding protein [Waddliaceae bacterium]MBT3579583.1 ABC transporter substrate-binding protein [Waddliaceae bacterium]MBT4444445.1 ABC transporter substrate-binding protein [Waddliaceae bacterium]MBT6928190.1 ABC transporter substrate-binding protein [Waddliaceae bacterium]MBT7264335.1 ABC transporter substrate-binding protein [Waddliaceae bacterium]